MSDTPEVPPQETGDGPVHASQMAVNEPAPPQTGDPKKDRQLALRKELNPLPMTEDEVGEWFKQLERAEKRIENLANSWDILVKEYMPVVLPSSSPEDVKVNLHFRNVHSKMSKLFPHTPEICCE